MKVPEDIARYIAQQAITEPYRQSLLLDTSEFARWLRDRDLDVSWQTIHQLALAGVLHPIAVIEGTGIKFRTERYIPVDLGYEANTFLDLGQNPLEADFGRLLPRMDLPYEVSHSMLWHPFQLWEIEQVVRRMRLNVTPDFTLASPDDFKKSIVRQQSRVIPRLIEFANSQDHSDFLQVLSILLLAEPLVITSLSTRVHVNLVPLGETIDGYFRWASEVDAKGTLDKIDLGIELAKAWHNKLAIAAQLSDPLERWRILVRHVPRRTRLTLGKAALKAEEFYYTAEVLRRYLEKFHGVHDLPEEDDALVGPQGSDFKEKLYGKARTADFDRSVFRQVVRRFELDPQPRLRWFVEGDTEVAFITRYAVRRHIDLTQSGIELVNLHGLGGLEGSRTLTLLNISRQEEVFAFISIDHDNIAKNPGVLLTYAEQKLLPAGFNIFDPNFEEVNFSLEELAEISTTFATAQGIEHAFSADEILLEMKQRSIPVGRAIERLWSRNRVGLRKGADWGYALADFVADRDRIPDVEDMQGERPVVSTFYRLFRAITSNYKLTVEECYINQDGEVLRNPA